MEELICKDCNSPAHVSVVFCDGTYGSKIQYCVICSNCKADTAIPQRFDTPEQATAAWNRRTQNIGKADICRECELANRNRELERRLSEMAIEVAIMRLLMLLKTGGKRRRKNNEDVI